MADTGQYGSTSTPHLQKRPNYAQLQMYSAIQRNVHRIHYDQAFAPSEEHPDVIVQGPLHGAFMVQLMTDCIGDEGFLKRISYSNRGRGVPGDILTCKGKVTKKYVQGDEHLVDCEIWIEDSKGQNTTPGWATVALPTREK